MSNSKTKNNAKMDIGMKILSVYQRLCLLGENIVPLLTKDQIKHVKSIVESIYIEGIEGIGR